MIFNSSSIPTKVGIQQREALFLNAALPHLDSGFRQSGEVM